MEFPKTISRYCRMHVLASLQNLKAGTHLMLQKSTRPLSKECAQVLQPLEASLWILHHPSCAADVWLLLPTNYCAAFSMLHPCCCWPCYLLSTTASALQLCCCCHCNICNCLSSVAIATERCPSIEPTVFKLMHLSTEFWLLLASTPSLKTLRCCWLCTVPAALLPTLLCVACWDFG